MRVAGIVFSSICLAFAVMCTAVGWGNPALMATCAAIHGGLIVLWALVLR